MARPNQSGMVIYDTLVSLDYLGQKTVDMGNSNFEYFHSFKYATLNSENMGQNELLISNDTIKIRLQTRYFDSLQLQNNLLTDSRYYDKHPFYGLDEVEIISLNSLHYKPRNQLDRIFISINGNEISLPKEEFANFFDVNILCTENHCPTKAYLTDEGDIILLMENGTGSGFYYAIFVFNNQGSLIDKIVKSAL